MTLLVNQENTFKASAAEHIAQALWSFFIAHPPEDAVFFMGTL